MPLVRRSHDAPQQCPVPHLRHEPVRVDNNVRLSFLSTRVSTNFQLSCRNGTFACLPCPRNTYARAGSIGVGACMASRPCTLADVAAVYTPCVHNLRNVTRSWAVPMTCNASLPDAIALPASNVNMDCGSCSSGYYTDDSSLSIFYILET